MIRDGGGAAVGQYVLAEADSHSDADVDSNDSRRAVEDAIAGPDSDSDATPTSWLSLSLRLRLAACCSL